MLMTREELAKIDITKYDPATVKKFERLRRLDAWTNKRILNKKMSFQKAEELADRLALKLGVSLGEYVNYFNKLGKWY